MKLNTLIGCALMLAACSPDATTTTTTPDLDQGDSTMQYQVFDESLAGELIQVSVGDIFLVSVRVNPTTGYSWEPTHPENLVLLDRDYQQDQIGASDGDSPQMVGVGGRELLKFEVVSEGEFTLLMVHSRPWDEDSEIDRFELAFATED